MRRDEIGWPWQPPEERQGIDRIKEDLSVPRETLQPSLGKSTCSWNGGTKGQFEVELSVLLSVNEGLPLANSIPTGK